MELQGSELARLPGSTSQITNGSEKDVVRLPNQHVILKLYPKVALWLAKTSWHYVQVKRKGKIWKAIALYWNLPPLSKGLWHKVEHNTGTCGGGLFTERTLRTISLD